ncbi:nuclear mitotic apparatus protein 1-like isoform X3 [Neodiprion fabricii]|uniref:nuclear mitotic apparatus protein 1-like isoform X3 n=1 Tax=Neodiprion fabricii TaxID=2872261 RepID=UPI001ED91ABA|nr:nuclear mitotic apparatus protein 1-like isoform X3 [Neodiprion fabricii]
MDEDEKRQRALEAGREMLAKYKAERLYSAHNSSGNQSAEPSDAESSRNEAQVRSTETRGANVSMNVSLRDLTHSSVSMSEGEGEGDLEGMAGRVAELEELLEGKEAVVEALNAEIENLRGEASSPNSSQSRASSINYKDLVLTYHAKLQEFERAVNQRDNLIEDLTASLEQTLSARDYLLTQVNTLNAMQLEQRTTPVEDIEPFHVKIEKLENELANQKMLTEEFKLQMNKSNEDRKKLEMESETQKAEINDYKLQINQLNERIRIGAAENNLNITETLEQQKQYEARVDKIKRDMQIILEKFTTETKANAEKHQNELKELSSSHSNELSRVKEDYKKQLKLVIEENRTLSDHLNRDLPDLETRHAKELSVFQTQLTTYKKTVEALKLELVNHSEAQRTAQAEVVLYKSRVEDLTLQMEANRRQHSLKSKAEKEMLQEQIKLHKIQLDEITSKYVAASSVLESKESIERSLEQALTNVTVLKQDNEALKFKLDDLSAKYSAAQSLIENSQVHERSMSSKIFDLEKSLSRFSGVSFNTGSEFNETTYQTFDEVALQFQMTKQRLEEKALMEKQLVERINGLENDVSKTTEDLVQANERLEKTTQELHKVNQELEKTNQVNRTYEKQLNDLKNSQDKSKGKLDQVDETTPGSTELFQGSLYFGQDEETPKEITDLPKGAKSGEVQLLKDKIELFERENKNLQNQLDQLKNDKLECAKKIIALNEKLKESEEESAQLKKGLAAAWEQCAEVEEKLNQTLAANESCLNESALNISIQDSKLPDQLETINDSARAQEILDKMDVKLIEKGVQAEVTNIQDLEKKIDDLNTEKAAIVKENENLIKLQRNYEEVSEKLEKLQQNFDKLQQERQRLIEENEYLTNKQSKEDINSLQLEIEKLTKEKESLVNEKIALIKQNEGLIEEHAKEMDEIKAQTVNDVQKLKSLSLGTSDNALSLSDLKAELETRHSKEMEELRTYFEQKCLQMEKQYSEEVFSQQSKKMSDNDSEIEELTDDLYFGGGGDCLNVLDVPGRSSKTDSELKSKIDSNEDENIAKSMAEGSEKVASIQQELFLKVEELEKLKSEYEEKLVEQQKLHNSMVQKLSERTEKRGLIKLVNQPCQTDLDPIAVESGELTELRAAYSHQLEEQVALAKLDIVNALQEQIQRDIGIMQALLSADETDAQQSWPAELLELRDKFTDGSKREIQELKEQHIAELARLKEEHTRLLNRTIERHEDELTKIRVASRGGGKTGSEDGNLSSENVLIRERDNLHKTCLTLKNLVTELINYFTMCEEEVNNTLISEVLKTQLSKSMEMKDDQEETSTKETGDKTEDFQNTTCPAEKQTPSKPTVTKIKRVHFAPRYSGIQTLMNDDNTLFELIERDKDVTHELKVELDNCLDRLKSEAAQILGVSSTPEESKIDMLAKQVLWSSKVNEELGVKFEEAENMIFNYEQENEHLKVKIHELQLKLTSIENKKEIISEGYGEHEESGVDVTTENLSQLQERVRTVISNGGGENSYLLQLIEDLCRQGDKAADEAKKEKEDLQLQVSFDPTPPPYIHRVCCRKIEAADKQLRATRKFLEEQAGEREAERDEAARKIEVLIEQLREKDREKERDQRITSEQSSLSPVPPSTYAVTRVLRPTDIEATVEALESQMHEMSSMMSEAEARKSEVESELKAAIDKIWVLRDIITDLEQQVQAKTEREDALQTQINQMEELINVQTKNQQELAQELDAIKMGSENVHLNEHIDHLQEELRKHKLSTEHFDVNSLAMKQIKLELRDMDVQLDKRIKDLEALHMCGSNLSLSQPSEDVSVREQIDASRCPTPDDPQSPPTLPLDHILKLKEKMIKHGRAEEVAFRRIKDLEMQMTALKNQNEELQAEQEILQQTNSEQLFQIEAMRGRLEQQKQSAPFAQRQATSRLELQLHEVNAKVHSLEREVADKDLQIKDTEMRLERANKLLLEKEGEIASVVQVENNTIQKLRDRLEVIEGEKKLLEEKVGSQERVQQELPQLLDSMLEDKNEEIDHLKDQLSKKEKQLEIYLSLNLDESQLKELMKQAEPKNSARTLSDILSINSECEEFPEAIREHVNLTQTLPYNISNLRTAGDASQLKYVSQISPMVMIEPNKTSTDVPRLELHSQSRSLSESCIPRSHSSTGVELVRSVSESKSPTNEENDGSNHENLRSRNVIENEANDENLSVERLSMETGESGVFKEGETSAEGINESANQCPRHGNRSNESLSPRKSGEESNQRLIQDMENQLRKVKEELEIKSKKLTERETELNTMQHDLLELRTELKETIETLTWDKFFYKEQFELAQASESKIKSDLLEVENNLKFKTEELIEYKGKMQTNEKIITELKKENSRMIEEFDEKLKTQLKKIDVTLQEKAQELKNLKEIIFEKDITIETLGTRNIEIENENKQLYEYKTRFETCREELSNCQIEVQRLTEGLNNRDLLIRRLEDMARRSSLSGASSPSENKDQEIHHLQEHLKEKDKVIRQMSDDSKSLQRALETIQNKMKESGNVVELRKKLKDERKMNMELKEVVVKLQEELEHFRIASHQASEDEGDIEDMVQRELQVSARLDKQIMSAIESETEESGGTKRRIERHACNSLDIEPVDQAKQEKIAQKYNDVRLKLKQANKSNEELTKLKDDLEIVVDMLKSQVTEYENRILQIKSDLEEESGTVTRLNEELAKEKDMSRHLRIRYEREQTANHQAQKHDSELITTLRMKIEASLDAEEKLRSQLSDIRRDHKRIETELNTVKEKLKNQKVADTVGLKEQYLQEMVEAEQKKYVTVAEKCEKEERKNVELADSIRRIVNEKSKYERELEMLNDDREKLASKLALVEGIKEHLETDLKRTRDELRAREGECEWLQKRIDTITEAEAKRQQQRTDEHNELKSLRREVANAREVMVDLEADMSHLKKQLAKSHEKQEQYIQCIETQRVTLADLMKKLTSAQDEEKRLKDVINDMQNDLQMSVKRELELTSELQRERLCGEKNVPVKFVQKIQDLNESLQKHLNEKSILHDKLARAREDKEQLLARVRILEQNQSTNTAGAMSGEMVEKLQHFYGKFLRTDSRRKALAYQKRYLLCVVGGYQLSEENTLSVLAQLTLVQREHTTNRNNKKSPRVRFRCAALAIISIRRMKWLIGRWRTGRRIGANAVLGNPDQSFIMLRKTSSNNHSPPVRDRPSNLRDGGLGGFPLEHFIDRFVSIEKKMDHALIDVGQLTSD